MPKAGGAVATVWSAPDAGGRRVVDQSGNLALSGSTLFAVLADSASGQSIGAFSTTGAASPTILVTLDGYATIAAYGSDVFWMTNTSGSTWALQEASLGGGPVTTLATMGPMVSPAVVAPDGTLYWTQGSGAVWNQLRWLKP